MTIAITHRGDPVGHRENTLPAFEAAVLQAADMVELDLRRTRDGVIVVLHDPTLLRLWGLDRSVDELDLVPVQALGQGEQRIPTFRQVLHDLSIPLMVDFTGDEVVEGALADVQEAGAMDRALFVTGHVGALRMLRRLSSSARIGLTWTEVAPPPPSLLAELGAEFWNPYFRLATPEHVAAVHRLGLQVSTWTVDEPRHMAVVAEAGVDAIVSNRIADLSRFPDLDGQIERFTLSRVWEGTTMRSHADVPEAIADGVTLRYMPTLMGYTPASILGVLLYHGGFSWAGGGVISVNVFFVLSGFLITTLLLKEWGRSNTIKLLSFWARRARRLLPALFLLLGGIALYIWIFAPSGTQGQFRGDALSTLFYFGNWHQLAVGQSYFAAVSAPSPVLHTWSLAIEEQFYLVWPLVVLGLMKLWRSTRVLLTVTVVGVVASATEMALLFHPGTDPSRLYYGTDTRAQDILVGAVVALVLLHRRPSEVPGVRRRWSWVGAAAMAVFAWEWLTVTGSSTWLYRGGFLLCDVAVGVVILAVTLAPRGLPARGLSVRPLTYLGRISYGLYLWHWPVFLVVDNARTGLIGWELFALRFAITFVIAVASWYLVEQPVRRMGFGALRAWSWTAIGAGATAGLLLISAAGTAATSGATALGPGDPQARFAAFRVTQFPKHSHLTRVLFVGDSLALYTGYNLAYYAAHYGIIIGGRAQSGCGIATTEPLDLHGTPQDSLAPCREEPALWQTAVDTLHPQVVAVIVGWWETMDRMYQGRWQHLGDPAFDAYETAKFEQAVSILSSRAHTLPS